MAIDVKSMAKKALEEKQQKATGGASSGVIDVKSMAQNALGVKPAAAPVVTKTPVTKQQAQANKADALGDQFLQEQAQGDAAILAARQKAASQAALQQDVRSTFGAVPTGNAVGDLQKAVTADFEANQRLSTASDLLAQQQRQKAISDAADILRQNQAFQQVQGAISGAQAQSGAQQQARLDAAYQKQNTMPYEHGIKQTLDPILAKYTEDDGAKTNPAVLPIYAIEELTGGALSSLSNLTFGLASRFRDGASNGESANAQKRIADYLAEHPDDAQGLYLPGRGGAHDWVLSRIAQGAGVDRSEVNFYRDANEVNNLVQNVRDKEEVSTRIKNTLGNAAYQIGTQLPGMIIGAGASKAIAQAVTLGVMGGSAYGAKLMENEQKYGFDWGNYISSIGSAAAEVGTELMNNFIPTLQNIMMVSTAGDFVWDSVSEGLEEIIGYPVETVIDWLFTKGGVRDPENRKSIDALGKSFANSFNMEEWLESGLEGAFVGALMGGSGVILNIAADTMKKSRSPAEIAEQLNEFVAKNIDDRLAPQPVDPNTATQEQVEDYVRQVAEAQAEQVERAKYGGSTAQEIANQIETVRRHQAAFASEQAAQNRENAQTAPVLTLNGEMAAEATQAAPAQTVRDYGAAQSDAFSDALNNMYSPALSASQYNAGMTEAYNAGLEGRPIESITSPDVLPLSQQQIQAAYNAGQIDSIRNRGLNNQASGATMETANETGGYSNVQEEASQEEGSDRNGEGSVGLQQERSGLTAGRVAERAGASGEGENQRSGAGRDRGSVQEVTVRANAKDSDIAQNATAGDATDAAALGIEGGNASQKVALIESGSTKATKASTSMAERNGYKATGFVGNYLSAQGNDSIQGASLSNGDILFSADDPEFTGERITGHEICEGHIRSGKINYRKAMDHARQTLGNAKVNRAVDIYKLINSDSKELVCDAAGNMNRLASVVEERPTLQEAKDLLDEVLSVLHDYVAQFADLSDVPALEGYSRNTTKANNLTTDFEGTVTDKSGRDVATSDGNGHTVFSRSTYKASGRVALLTYLDSQVKSGYLDAADAADMMSQMDELYRITDEFEGKYATFGAWSNAEVVRGADGKPAFSVVKKNGEYALNLDFSLVCKKRRALDAVFNELILRGSLDNFDMGERSIVRINDMIREAGFETACALCFVDSKRFRQALVADSFTSLYNNLVRSMAPEGASIDYFNFGGNSLIENTGSGIDTMKNSDLDFAEIDRVLKKYGSKTVEYKTAMLLKNNPAQRKLLLRGDFMSTAGLDEVAKTNKDVLKLYNSKKGTGGPKAAQSDVQYLNEILTKKSFNAAKAYSVGGVRIQSFSDYIPRLVFDYVQMVADLAAKKLPAHAYTKEAIFAQQFGKTGIKINLSLVPAVAEDGVAPGLDKDGKYLWKDGQSFGSDVNVEGSGATGFDLAVRLQNAEGYSKNVGTIAVGVSDRHITKMLDDPNIRMIIPYHKSSLNHIVAVMNNIDAYHDYSDEQNTIDKTTGNAISKKLEFSFNDALRRTGDAKAAADEYKAWCEENNYEPKFPNFASHENYYKLLEDFSCYDENGAAAPQGAVTMTFPKEGDAFGSMRDLIESGLNADDVLQNRLDAGVIKLAERIEAELPAMEREWKTEFSSAVDPKSIARAIEMIHNGDTASSIYEETGLVYNGHRLTNGFSSEEVWNEKEGIQAVAEGSVHKGRDGILSNDRRAIGSTVGRSPESQSRRRTWKELGRRDRADVTRAIVEEINKLEDMPEELEVLILSSSENWEEKVARLFYDAYSGGSVNVEYFAAYFPNYKAIENRLVDLLERRAFSSALDRSTLDALVEKYGAIEPGEKAYREVSVPKKTADDKYVSQTIRTVLEARATPDVAVPEIESLVTDGTFSYDRYTDKQAIADAEKKIGSNWEEAFGDWLLEGKKLVVSKEHTATGWALYNNAANAGNLNTAMRVLEEMVKSQRNAAQALQATRILKKLSPDAQLYGVVRSVEGLQKDINKRYGRKGAPELVINQQLAEEFLRAETDEARAEVYRKIYADIGRQIPPTLMDKWNAWRYLAMLGNPRTHVRNIAGNAIFMPVVSAKNVTANAIESITSFVTRGNIGRTKSFLNPASKADRALISAAFKDMANVGDRLEGKKYDDNGVMQDAIEEGRRIFRIKPLEWLRVTNSKALGAEDMWFKTPYYGFALASYCKANHISAEQVRSGKGIEPARIYAIKEAMKATYNDTNAFSQWVSGIGRVRADANRLQRLGAAAVNGVLPFRKTPANILVRGIEYSPIGLLKALSYDSVQVARGEMTAAQMIDDVSAGLTGTALLGLGFLLSRLGWVRGHGSDDKDKDLAAMQGHQNYALELPNGTSITIDWVAPESIPLFVGVNVYEQLAKGDELDMALILESLKNISEPLLEMSMLQGLNDVFEAVGYASTNDMSALSSVLTSAATSYVMQAFPTVLGQAERTAQDKRVTTFTTNGNKWLTRDMQYTLGKISAKVPIWDFQQVPYIDAWGREELTGNAAVRAANNFLNPAYVKKIDENKVEEELMRVYRAADSGRNVFPTRAKNSFKIDGETLYLNEEQYIKYATVKGQTSYALADKLIQMQAYKKLSDADKAKAIADAYSLADVYAKKQVSKYATTGWMERAASSTIPLDKYLEVNLAVSGIKSIKDEDGKAISDTSGLLKMQAIYAIRGLTDKQRQQLFADYDVGKRVIGYNSAKVDEELSKYR